KQEWDALLRRVDSDCSPDMEEVRVVVDKAIAVPSLHPFSMFGYSMMHVSDWPSSSLPRRDCANFSQSSPIE
ncbi:hypothetical protein PENTCL1PPCAC_22933, partial [Pristionchus entomophagus]